MDLGRLRLNMADRMLRRGDQVAHSELPMRADAQAAIDAAVALATERRHYEVHGVHLLAALVQDERGPAAKLLTQHGVDVQAVAQRLKGAF